MKKQTKQPKKITYLDYACHNGERVQWQDIVGKKFEGTLLRIVEDTAIVKLDDGTEMEVAV